MEDSWHESQPVIKGYRLVIEIVLMNPQNLGKLREEPHPSLVQPYNRCQQLQKHVSENRSDVFLSKSVENE